MTIDEMKKINEEKGFKFFSEENKKWWGFNIAAEPNEYGLFITSSKAHYEFDARDDEGNVYCLKQFCLETGKPEGIIQNGRNYGSYKQAVAVRDGIAERLKPHKGSIFNISNNLNTPEIVDFIFEDGTTVTVNINEIGGQYESNI